ncbi:energy transducer TonB [Roseofilum capinflatum]|uniref:TonB family protein n=1 Tax=Roseofilum capinflatum BLCC-M114 TaxID=3022440 RepID=A0ABT7BAJ8_9CYAN|nr:energy transducer TonB [Roseofilum capinflatum]MDJ1176199.1 TonB family protein [Roseofilum capinflatum BLCC-M114]
MTYSPLFPQQRQPALQPFWIATIASVAFHGLLWINIPIRSGSPRPSLDAVDLVELTPEQLERLPNLNSPSQLTLPPINPEAWQQQPLPNPPGNPSANSSSAENPSSFVLPPPRASLELPPPPVLQLPPISSTPPYREPLVIPTLPPPPPSSPPVYDDANPLPVLPPSDLDLEINRLAENPEENTETSSPPQPPEPTGEEEQPEPEEPGVLPDSIPEAAIADLRRRQEQYRQQAEASENPEEEIPEPESSPVAAVPPEEEIPEPESSPVTALPPEEETPEPEATPEPDDPLLAEIQALREAIAYNPEGTSDQEATAALESWFNNIPDRYKNEDNTSGWKQKELNVPLPELACRSQLQGRATIGVLVNPEGEIIREAKLIQSTGYAILNEAALQSVRSYAFEPTEIHQLYLIEVIFEPLDSCSAST